VNRDRLYLLSKLRILIKARGLYGGVAALEGPTL